MPMRVQRSASQEAAAQARQLEQEVARDLRQAQADARQAQADVRQAANDARQDAIQADPQGTSVATSVSPDGFTKTITYPNGRGGYSKIVIDRNGVQIGGDRVSSSTRSLGQRDIPPNVKALADNMFASVALILIGVPMVRGFWRWVERRGTPVTVQPEVMQRLAAIENAVESIAVEVERVSEGQRFTTKLLSKRTHVPAEEFVVSGAHVRLDRLRG